MSFVYHNGFCWNLKWVLTSKVMTRTSLGRDSWLNILLDAMQHYRICRQMFLPSQCSPNCVHVSSKCSCGSRLEALDDAALTSQTQTYSTTSVFLCMQQDDTHIFHVSAIIISQNSFFSGTAMSLLFSHFGVVACCRIFVIIDITLTTKMSMEILFQ